MLRTTRSFWSFCFGTRRIFRIPKRFTGVKSSKARTEHLVLKNHPVQITKNKRSSHFICQDSNYHDFCVTKWQWRLNPLSVPKDKQLSPLWSSHVCGNCKEGAGKSSKNEALIIRESQQAVIVTTQSWLQAASLPVSFRESRLFRPFAPNQWRCFSLKSPCVSTFTPRKHRNQFTSPFHYIEIHFRISPAKDCDVISPGP